MSPATDGYRFLAGAVTRWAMKSRPSPALRAKLGPDVPEPLRGFDPNFSFLEKEKSPPTPFSRNGGGLFLLAAKEEMFQ